MRPRLSREFRLDRRPGSKLDSGLGSVLEFVLKFTFGDTSEGFTSAVLIKSGAHGLVAYAERDLVARDSFQKKCGEPLASTM